MYGPNMSMWIRGQAMAAERREAQQRGEWNPPPHVEIPEEMYGPPTRRTYWLGRIGKFLFDWGAVLLLVGILAFGAVQQIVGY